MNGVPLKRLNQAYCIPTSTRVSLKGVEEHSAGVSDDFFGRKK